MQINLSKSKVMFFNKSRKYDFPPEYVFRNGEILECLEEIKLLGIQLSSDFKRLKFDRIMNFSVLTGFFQDF